MTRKTPQQLWEELQKKKAALARVEARLSVCRRKTETRRKILAGAFLLNHAQKNAAFAAWVQKSLPRFLTARDQQLFRDLLGEQPTGKPARGAGA
jgi:hypothetical protein